MTKAATPDKWASESLKARKRAAEIYADLTKASNGKPPIDRIIRDCLCKEGWRAYTPAMISKWRRADKWDQSTLPAKDLPPILLTYQCDANLSLDDIKSVAAKGVKLHMKLASVFEKWIDGLDPATLEVNEGLRVYEILGKSAESVESLRVRLAEQSITEARNVTPDDDGEDRFAEIAEKYGLKPSHDPTMEMLRAACKRLEETGGMDGRPLSSMRR